MILNFHVSFVLFIYYFPKNWSVLQLTIKAIGDGTIERHGLARGLFASFSGVVSLTLHRSTYEVLSGCDCALSDAGFWAGQFEGHREDQMVVSTNIHLPDFPEG